MSLDDKVLWGRHPVVSASLFVMLILVHDHTCIWASVQVCLFNLKSVSVHIEILLGHNQIVLRRMCLFYIFSSTIYTLVKQVVRYSIVGPRTVHLLRGMRNYCRSHVGRCGRRAQFICHLFLVLLLLRSDPKSQLASCWYPHCSWLHRLRYRVWCQIRWLFSIWYICVVGVVRSTSLSFWELDFVTLSMNVMT